MSKITYIDINMVLSALFMMTTFLAAAEDVTYTTPLGPLIGVRRRVLNKTVYEFKNIPFAKPPIGNLRFEKPERYGQWQGTLDARQFGPSCYQNMGPESLAFLQNKEVSEDCLQLNIYVPFTLSTESNKHIMVWIHGGGFMTGQAQLYDGAYLAVTGDVIIITINYRLNGLGFFQAESFKGNYGLWDQIMALQWVKDEIKAYGGNSESVTIFGESAGGFSVGLLSIIPSNQGLFKRAIMQSGTAINPYSTGSLPNIVSTAISQRVNCTFTSSNQFENCMKNADPGIISLASNGIFSTNAFQAAVGPVIDNELLTGNPRDLLSDPNSQAAQFYKSLDVMIGIVDGEASLLVDILPFFGTVLGYDFNISDSIPKEILCDTLVPDLVNTLYNNNTQISAAICNKYWQGSTKDEKSNSLTDVFLDIGFHLPAVLSLRYHASGNKKHYHYLFSRPSQYPVFGQSSAKWFTRSTHATEIMFEFPFLELSQEDQSLALNLMTYWTNFAKTGNVNSPGLPQWNEYDLTDGHYINLDVDITNGQHLYKDRVDFWLSEIPQIINPSPSTAMTTTIDPTGSAPLTHSASHAIYLILTIVMMQILQRVLQL